MDENSSLDGVHVDELLVHVVEANYGELHLDVGKPPYMSQRGTNRMIELTDYEPARPAHIQRMIYDILSDEQIVVFEDELSLLFTHVAPHVAKFGVFVVRDLQNIAATFHVTPLDAHDIK